MVSETVDPIYWPLPNEPHVFYDANEGYESQDLLHRGRRAHATLGMPMAYAATQVMKDTQEEGKRVNILKEVQRTRK